MLLSKGKRPASVVNIIRLLLGLLDYRRSPLNLILCHPAVSDCHFSSLWAVTVAVAMVYS